MSIMNLVAPKAGAKQEHLFKKLTSASNLP